VVRWLVLGVLINAIARILMITLQGAGRPDLTAKTHLLEIVPYAAAIWFLTTKFGITGAAAAWCLRMLMDALALSFLTYSLVPELKPAMHRTVILWLLLTGSLPMTVFWLDSVTWRISLAVLVCSHAAWRLRPVVRSILGDGESKRRGNGHV
jgi:O-antigen/teichoic acid export membrane protein